MRTIMRRIVGGARLRGRGYAASLALLGSLRLFGTLGVILACNESSVGDPCIPEDEYRADFSGYSKEEVNVESRSFQCETRLCLVNKFQGRVSCPAGQTSEGGECRTPDGALRVSVPVAPQLVARPPSDAVYCSCRCADPLDRTGSTAPTCECPEGFECTELIPNVELGDRELAGSYCVKQDTDIEASQLPSEEL
jgi:hypothetical protein